MLLKTLQRNSLVVFAILPFLMVVFWGKALFFSMDYIPLNEINMPLYDLAARYLWRNAQMASFTSLFLAFMVMFGLNRFNTKYLLLKRPSILPGIMYLILVSGFTSVQMLQPVWFFAPLFLLALEILFNSIHRKEHAAEIFNASFLLSVGSLFYAKGLFFLPFLWWCMMLLNTIRFRYVLASLLGTAIPYLFTLSFFFFFNKTQELLTTLQENFLSPVAFLNNQLIPELYLGLLIALTILSILVVFRLLSTLKIVTRKYYKVFVWLVIFAGIFAITPFYTLEIIPIMGIGGALLLANFFDNVRSNFWKELIFSLLLIITLLVQLLVK
jgi:hypothetical protein